MSELRERTIDRIKQATYGNAILANNIYRLLEEFTMNGFSATDIEDKIDWDSVLDSKIGYRMNKARVIEYLKNQGYHSEKEMMLDDAMRVREENRILDSSEKRRKEENALIESEEAKAKFNLALAKLSQEAPLESVLPELLPELKKLDSFLDMTLTGKYSNGCILSGPAGLSKTFKVLHELQKRNVKFELYNAHASSLGLFELLHVNRTGVVVLDDLESIMEDKRSVGILKAASFSATGVREVTWNSTTKVLAERGLPSRFIFEGKIIIVTNDEYKTRNPSFQALLSRMPVFKLNFNMDARKILVRSVIIKQDMFGLPPEDKKKVLEYMESLLDYSKMENYNLRTAIRAMEIYKLRGDLGNDLIAELLGTDERIRKFLLIEDRAAHLPVAKRKEVWKEYTGLSASTYHLIKSRYYADKYDNISKMEKELEELDALIEEKGRL